MFAGLLCRRSGAVRQTERAAPEALGTTPESVFVPVHFVVNQGEGQLNDAARRVRVSRLRVPHNGWSDAVDVVTARKRTARFASVCVKCRAYLLL
jgi:hypothetical protein